MSRHFNRTGFCNPEMHYIVDPLRGFETEIMGRIKSNEYFTIHAPRQSGKTTLLHALSKTINDEGEYLSFAFSVETAGYQSIPEPLANYRFISSLYNRADVLGLSNHLPELPEMQDNLSFKDYLHEFAKKCKKPIVLLIDEVDSLYDDIFISFLRQLRDGFQDRPSGFPASIALVGLRDVREYKMKVRTDSHSMGSGSPFNIKAESYRLQNFSLEQVSKLLRQHTEDTGQAFSDEVCSLVYEYTDGQPWLVNALAYELVNYVLGKDYSREILPEHVEMAKDQLIKRRDTHLDSMGDKLKEPRVKRIVEAIINGEHLLHDDFNDDLLYCEDLGIVKQSNGRIEFGNKIYKEVIPRIINYAFQCNIVGYEQQWYVKPDGKLDMDALLKAFQQFYRRHSESWIDRFSFKEAGHQLLLMAFLQRILNGGAKIEREMSIGNGRVDLAVMFAKEVFLLELKINKDQYVYEEGLEQVSRYADRYEQSSAYLILFEPQKSNIVSWESRISWNTVAYEYMGKTKEIKVISM